MLLIMYSKILLVFEILVVTNSLCDDRKIVPFPPEVEDNIVKATKECLLQYDKESKIIELIRQGSYSRLAGVDDSFKNFIHCAYFKSGYSNEDGTARVAKIIKTFPADANVGPATKECSKIKGKDAIDTTYQFFKCFEVMAPIRLALNKDIFENSYN